MYNADNINIKLGNDNYGFSISAELGITTPSREISSLWTIMQDAVKKSIGSINNSIINQGLTTILNFLPGAGINSYNIKQALWRRGGDNSII